MSEAPSAVEPTTFSTYLLRIKAHRTEHGTSINEARAAVDAGWRPGPDPRDAQIARLTEQVRVARAGLQEVVWLSEIGSSVQIKARETLTRMEKNDED